MRLCGSGVTHVAVTKSPLIFSKLSARILIALVINYMTVVLRPYKYIQRYEIHVLLKCLLSLIPVYGARLD
jgi:hypothetical protein